MNFLYHILQGVDIGHKNIIKMNLAIEKPWESYNVVNIFNTTSEKKIVEINLEKDLGLDNAEYLVYDYTEDSFVGIVNDSFKVELDKCESKVLSVRRRLDIPQIVSTSRHLSQGAAEIKALKRPNANEIILEAEVIDGADYTITLYIPDGFKASKHLINIGTSLYKKTITPKKTETEKIKFSF